MILILILIFERKSMSALTIPSIPVGSVSAPSPFVKSSQPPRQIPQNGTRRGPLLEEQDKRLRFNPRRRIQFPEENLPTPPQLHEKQLVARIPASPLPL